MEANSLRKEVCVVMWCLFYFIPTCSWFFWFVFFACAHGSEDFPAELNRSIEMVPTFALHILLPIYFGENSKFHIVCRLPPKMIDVLRHKARSYLRANGIIVDHFARILQLVNRLISTSSLRKERVVILFLFNKWVVNYRLLIVDCLRVGALKHIWTV